MNTGLVIPLEQVVSALYYNTATNPQNNPSELKDISGHKSVPTGKIGKAKEKEKEFIFEKKKP